MFSEEEIDLMRSLGLDCDFNSLSEPPREDSVSSSSNMNNMETVSVDKDPFEAFGDSIEISDNDLPF